MLSVGYRYINEKQIPNYIHARKTDNYRNNIVARESSRLFLHYT